MTMATARVTYYLLANQKQAVTDLATPLRRITHSNTSHCSAFTPYFITLIFTSTFTFTAGLCCATVIHFRELWLTTAREPISHHNALKLPNKHQHPDFSTTYLLPERCPYSFTKI
jgi:hypothetical protein